MPIAAARLRAILCCTIALFLLLTLVPLLAAPAEAAASTAQPAAARPDSKGKDFWLAFPGNLGEQSLELFVTADYDTTGRVEIPGMGWQQPFAVAAGRVSTVLLPPSAQLTTNDGTQARGIHVVAADEVTVYGLNRVQYTTDAFLALPTDILGTDYLTLGYHNANIVNGSQFAVAAAHDDTRVTIVPSTTTGVRQAGVPYVVELDAGQAYQLRNTSAPRDLSGTHVTSDKPISVFGSHQCANVPNGAYYCDHVVEQMFPVSTWGRSFVTVPLATRRFGDTFRFLSARDGTEVRLNGALVATLARGRWHEQIVDGSAHITASEPILVAQYANGSTYDGAVADPFMMLVPPHEQFLNDYTVSTLSSGIKRNFLNVVVPTASAGSVVLDGATVPADRFTAIGTSGFSGAQIPVSIGSHRVRASRAFGLFVYGFDDYDSYGYPGGLSLSEVATAASLSLEPETAPPAATGTQACVTAVVADAAGGGLEGVRVDVRVTGANDDDGFVFTDEQGRGQFCYVGSQAGEDAVEARVGELTDRVVRRWTGANRADASYGLRRSGGYAGDPVNTATGNFVAEAVDVEAPATVDGLTLTRTYNSLDVRDSAFGRGWSSLLDQALDARDPTSVDLRAADGRRVTFPATSDGYARAEEFAARLVRSAEGAFQLEGDDGSVTRFDTAGRITSWTGWDDQQVRAVRDAAGRITELRSSTGAVLALAHDAAGRVTRLRSDDGREATFSYDRGTLVAATGPTGATTRYGLDEVGRIMRVEDATGVVVAEVGYDGSGRVDTQGSPAGTTYRFEYGTGVTKVSDVRDGSALFYRHDSMDRLVALEDAAGAVLTKEYDGEGNLVGVVDRLGSRTDQTFDARGNLLSSTESGGERTTWVYDSDNRLSSMTSPTGAVTRYGYEGKERLPSSITEPNGSVSRYDVVNGLIVEAVDPDGVRHVAESADRRRLVAVVDGLGRRTTYEHDGLGNETAVTSPLGATTRFTYDALGRLTSEVDATGAATRYELDAAGRILSVSDPTGAVTRSAYDDAGRLVSVTDARGGVTRSEYDRLGRLVRVVSAGGSSRTSSYGAMSRVTETADATGAATTYLYDAEGRVVATVDALGRRSTQEYDHRGRVTSRTDPLGRTTRFRYDAEDRLLSEVDAAGAVTAHEYDAVGNLLKTVDRAGGVTARTYTPGHRLSSETDPVGLTTTYRYDAAGQLATETTGTGRVTAYGYDDDGRTVRTTSPGGLVSTAAFDAVGRAVSVTLPGRGTTRYSYSARGEVTSVIDATGGRRAYAYDTVGNQVAATDPRGGITRVAYDLDGRPVERVAPDGSTERYRYDAAGRPVARIDALGRTTTTEYDAVGRAIRTSDPSGRSISTEYDAADQILAQTAGDGSRRGFTYDVLGRRTSETDERGTVRYSFDPEGRVTSRTDTDGRVLRLRHDAAGRRTVLERPSGRSETLSYDADGLLSALTRPDGAVRYAYDADGALLSESLPGGKQRRYTYRNGLLSGYQQDASAYAAGSAIERDDAGRRTAETRAGRTTRYAYDAGGQLGEFDGAAAEYDARGRRSLLVRDGQQTRYRYDAAGQLLSETTGSRTTTYSYDAAGRRTAASDGNTITTTSYDAWGQPSAVTRTRDDKVLSRSELRFDAAGHLVEVAEGSRSTRIDWDTEREVAEPLSLREGGTETELVHGASRAFAVREAKVAVHDLDSQGSVLQSADSLGLARAQSYGAFGEPVDASTRQGLGLGYRGELQVADLVHLRARRYDPNSGTFTTPDPLDTPLGEATTTAPYAYAANDPINQVDPLGLSAVTDDAFRPHAASSALRTSGVSGGISNAHVERCLRALSCTFHHFEAMSTGQRRSWLAGFQNGFGREGNFKNWFNAIDGILRFASDKKLIRRGSWFSIVDAGILQGIQDGLAMLRGKVSVYENPGAAKWRKFFQARADRRSDTVSRSLWGAAEQAATNFGLARARAVGARAPRGGSTFASVGNVYRGLLTHNRSIRRAAGDIGESAGRAACGYILGGYCGGKGRSMAEGAIDGFYRGLADPRNGELTYRGAHVLWSGGSAYEKARELLA